MMQRFASAGPHISVKADEVANVMGVSITNSHMLGALGLIVLVWLMFRTRAAVLGKKKHNFATRLVHWTFDGLYNTPLFRGGVADLNMTFCLAIVTIVAAQVYAFKYLGFKGNMGRYFVNPLRDPIMAFVGILELVAEFSRLLGLSFRLFGNVLAGEVLLIMIAFLTQFISPAALQPFYLFELFIGGIQAYIFFMLSTVFISLGLAHHDTHEPTDHAHSPADTTKLAAAND